MRDPARIDRMIEVLRQYWHKHPDLRLGQIISNATDRQSRQFFEDTNLLFYLEDTVMEKCIQDLANPPIPKHATE